MFVNTLGTMLGVRSGSTDASKRVADMSDRVETLEQLFIEKAAELEQVKHVLTMLMMSNPNVRVVGTGSGEDGVVEDDVLGSITGSFKGPDGGLLN